MKNIKSVKNESSKEKNIGSKQQQNKQSKKKITKK